MAKNEHQEWAESQIETLVNIGIDLAEAQRSVNWVLDNLPEGEDPATYIFSGRELWENPDSPENVADSRADWYASDSVPNRYKRLLDAQEDTED